MLLTFKQYNYRLDIIMEINNYNFRVLEKFNLPTLINSQRNTFLLISITALIIKSVLMRKY